MFTATEKDHKHNLTSSVGSQEEPCQQVDEEILITNHVSDNPSRHHIPKSAQKKRPSQNADRYNKTLSRDPRWVAHISAAKPRREAAPARLPIPRKRISEQRQIFWPNGAITKPPRRRCSAKKKHIGQMSSLVYCSYPPSNPVVAGSQVENITVQETRSNTVVTNGDVLSMMFHRHSTQRKRRRVITDELPLSKSSTSNKNCYQNRVINGETHSKTSKSKLKVSKRTRFQVDDIVNKVSKSKDLQTRIDAHKGSKRKALPVVERVGEYGDLKTQKSSSKLKILGMGFQRHSTTRRKMKKSHSGGNAEGTATLCKASTSSNKLPQKKDTGGKSHGNDLKTSKPSSKRDILAMMFYRPSSQSNTKKPCSGVNDEGSMATCQASTGNNRLSENKGTDGKTHRKDLKFCRRSTKKPRSSDNAGNTPALIKPSTSNNQFVQNRNKTGVRHRNLTKRKCSQVMENTEECFDRKRPQIVANVNKTSTGKRLQAVESLYEFEPSSKKTKRVKTRDPTDIPSTSVGIVSTIRREPADLAAPHAIFNCMRKGQNYIKNRKKVRRKRNKTQDLCRVAQVRNALNIEREDSACDEATSSSSTLETKRKKAS